MDGMKISKKNISRSSQIKMLWNEFPSSSLEIGRVITYEELEKVLQEKRTANRFRGIFGAWREQVLMQAGKVLITIINVGYKVADSHQKLAKANSLQKSGIKSFTKSSVVLDTVAVNELSNDEQVQYRKNKNLIASMNISFKRNLEMPNI